MGRKVITGIVDGKKITRFIENYQPNIPEQVLTEKRNIRNQFEDLGYDGDTVIFEER